MTAQEWVMKFGVHWDPDNEDGDIVDKNGDVVEMMDSNLEDIACPECSDRSRFRINVEVLSVVKDDSIVPDEPDMDGFNVKSYCRCLNCNEDGAVRDFTMPGLDELLHKIYNNEITEPKFDAELTPKPDPKLVEKLAAIIDEAVDRNKQQAEQAQTIGWDTSNIKQ